MTPGSGGVDTPCDAGESRLASAVRGVEQVFFALLIGLLIVAGLTPFVVRHLLGYFGVQGPIWPSPLSQHLLLWIALFGAGAATRDRKHIAIDVVSPFLGERARRGLRASAELVAAVICAVLFPSSVAFLRSELEYGSGTAFFGIPEAWLPAVIPIGLALLILRFVLAAVDDALNALRPPPSGPPPPAPGPPPPSPENPS